MTLKTNGSIAAKCIRKWLYGAKCFIKFCYFLNQLIIPPSITLFTEAMSYNGVKLPKYHTF